MSQQIEYSTRASRVATTIEGVANMLQKALGVPLTIIAILVSGLIATAALMRYLFNYPIGFAEDLTVYIIGWFYLLGAARGTWVGGGHLTGGFVHVLTRNVAVRRWFALAGDIIAFAVSALMAFWAGQFFITDLAFGGETQVLYLPIPYARLSLFVGLLIASFYFLARVATTLLKASFFAKDAVGGE